MTDNPFQSPGSAEAVIRYPSGQPRAAGALTVILIFCLIISGLGFLGSCLGSLGTAMNYAIMNEVGQPNPNDPGAAFAKKMEEVNNAVAIPNMIVMGLNFIIAPLMFTGAIGCLNRKTWGHSLLRWSLVAAIIFIFLRSIFSFFVQLRMKSVMGEGFGNAMNKGGPDPQTMASFMSGFFWVMIILGIIWTVVQAGFYLWSYLYLNKPEIKTYLGAK